MKIKFTLNTGKEIDAEIPNFNSEDFAKQINDPHTLVVHIGNNGFSKHALQSWNEVKDEPVAE